MVKSAASKKKPDILMRSTYESILTTLCCVGWLGHIYFVLLHPHANHVRLLHMVVGIYGPFAAVNGWLRILGVM
ncbi:MAG TPA: hypothetical protein VMF53_15110 [Alphaproteobacteria bacterium]|nr:hypothetical protein [Alphaproteobacteria bacterium]